MAGASPPPRPRPHVVIFPLPAQGHVNSMLKLAELLCLFDLRITFLNSERNHRCLLHHSDAMSRFVRHDGFRFKEISDGIPANQDDSLLTDDKIMSICNYLKDSARGVLEDIVSSAAAEGSPVTCIIADGILNFVTDVGEEIGGVPVIIFRTISACCFWAYFCIPPMIEAGELPIRGKEDMDRLITSIPGAEGFLRCRDLPSFCRTSDLSNPIFQYITTQTRQSTLARGIIFNTCEDLELPILSNIRPHFTKVYLVGPLHAHLKSRLLSMTNQQQHRSSNSLLEEDRSCLSWLDRQPPRSVLYVSFGSITVLKPGEVTEFMFGIINSKCRFLWVMRPDSVADHDGDRSRLVPVELKAAAKERGCFVEWAPQEDVLSHPAVAGFLTHSGWNSTLESVAVGVPMVCWPYFADQQINSRFVSEVWKIGVDMKDQCDRVVIERMINDLMVGRREELAHSAADKARLVKEAVSEGGSSWEDLNGLVTDICSMSLGNNSVIAS